MPKWMDYIPVLMFDVSDIYDINYFDLMSTVIAEAYQEKYNTSEVPDMQFCHMYNSDDIGGPLYLPMIVMDSAKCEHCITPILIALKFKYKLQHMQHKNGYVYISPFTAWEEVAFWQTKGGKALEVIRERNASIEECVPDSGYVSGDD